VEKNLQGGYWGGGAGSYPYVEYWELDYKETEVIEAIKDLKTEDKSIQPPNQTALTFGRDSSYWYYIDFYYSDTKEIVHTWTRPSRDSFGITLALISFSKLSNPEKFKYINKDFWYVANKIQINKFEENILRRIKRKIWETRKKRS
jgi:hypothetical protein